MPSETTPVFTEAELAIIQLVRQETFRQDLQAAIENIIFFTPLDDFDEEARNAAWTIWQIHKHLNAPQ